MTKIKSTNDTMLYDDEMVIKTYIKLIDQFSTLWRYDRIDSIILIKRERAFENKRNLIIKRERAFEDLIRFLDIMI